MAPSTSDGARTDCEVGRVWRRPSTCTETPAPVAGPVCAEAAPRASRRARADLDGGTGQHPHAERRAPGPGPDLDRRLESMRPGSGQRQREPDESAQQEHACRRADPEYQEVQERADRGGDRAEDQQRERGASREPVEEPDQEGTAAEPDEVDVRPVWRAEMELRVAVSHAARMGVLAPMGEERAEGAQKHVAAQ